MAKPKFNLTPSPTFKAVVAIPVPGGEPADVEFTFKHRTRDGFREFIDSLKGAENVDMLLDIASGWDLDEPFDKDSLAKLEQQYMGAAQAVINVYMAELTGNRTKN